RTPSSFACSSNHAADTSGDGSASGFITHIITRRTSARRARGRRRASATVRRGEARRGEGGGGAAAARQTSPPAALGSEEGWATDAAGRPFARAAGLIGHIIHQLSFFRIYIAHQVRAARKPSRGDDA